MNLKDDLLSFHRDGFLQIKSVFTHAEVAKMRQAAQRFAEDAQAKGHIFQSRAAEICPAADLLSAFGEDVLFDARIQQIAHTLLGKEPNEEIVYFGDSGVMIGGHGRGFHKDNTCRTDASHPDWTTPYTLVRLGIYLENHDQWSGGVKVRRGSHLVPDVTTGEIVDVPTRAGDVVAWSLRTTHSGHAIRVKGLPFLHLQPRFELRLPRPLHVPEAETRVALFMTFGLDDIHLKNYLAKHTDFGTYPDNYLYKQWLYSTPSKELQERGKQAGCRVVHPVSDYGKLWNSESLSDGYVHTGSSQPDNYPATGSEALIRGVGKIVRAVLPSTAS